MAGEGRRRGVRRLIWMTVLLVPLLVVVALGLVALEARDRLPELLAWAVRELVPGVHLQVASARLESSDRFVAEDLEVRLGDATKPVFATKRLEVDFALSEIWEGRIRAVHSEQPIVVWTTETTRGYEGGAAADEAESFGWSVDHVSAPGGQAEISGLASVPPVAFEFDLDQRDVGTTAQSASLVRDVAVTRLRIGDREHPLLTTPRLSVRASIDGARRARIEELRVESPEIDLSVAPSTGASENARAEDGTFEVGHLVFTGAHVVSPPAGNLPGVEARFDLDLKDIADSGELASRLHTVDVQDVRVTLPGPRREPLFTSPHLSADISLAGVMRERSVAALRLPDGSLLLDGAGRRFLFASGTDAAVEERSDDAWRIGTLEIGTLAVHVAELGPPLPDVTFDVHTTMKDLPLSAAAAAIADETQQLELASLALYSPFDPFKKVVTVGSIFVDFSLGGLTRQRVHKVKMLRPTIYLAEDLFWYMTNERQDATSSPPSPWTIDLLQAELGSLILEIGKARRVGLPITFETEVRDVKLDNLADLKLAAQLQVPEESYSFPDYDVSVERVHGQLQFDYPPGKGSENFVSTLYADAFEWRDYSLQEGWLSLTFDPKGINGTFGGAGYAGYVNGGVTVPYAWNEPWVGWVSASDIDLAEVTAVLANGAVEMTGPLDANIALTIENQTLETAKGDLLLEKPGRLELTRLNESQIPADWPSWQRDLGKIALETLRNFDYDTGRGKLDFERGVGLATLDLAGPNGGRNLEVHFHGKDADPLDLRVASREDGE